MPPSATIQCISGHFAFCFQLDHGRLKDFFQGGNHGEISLYQKLTEKLFLQKNK